MNSRKNQKSLGLAIRAVRKERGWSQLQMAKEMGISNKQLWNIETGNNWPSLPVYAQMCHRVLKVAIPGFPLSDEPGN